MGHLVPPDQVPVGANGPRPRLTYHQLYIYDPQNELENRLAFIPDLNEDVTLRFADDASCCQPVHSSFSDWC